MPPSRYVDFLTDYYFNKGTSISIYKKQELDYQTH